MTNSKNKTLSILIVIMIFIGCNKENKKTILYQEQKRITLNKEVAKAMAIITTDKEIRQEIFASVSKITQMHQWRDEAIYFKEILPNNFNSILNKESKIAIALKTQLKKNRITIHTTSNKRNSEDISELINDLIEYEIEFYFQYHEDYPTPDNFAVTYQNEISEDENEGFIYVNNKQETILVNEVYATNNPTLIIGQFNNNRSETLGNSTSNQRTILDPMYINIGRLKYTNDHEGLMMGGPEFTYYRAKGTINVNNNNKTVQSSDMVNIDFKRKDKGKWHDINSMIDHSWNILEFNQVFGLYERDGGVKEMINLNINVETEIAGIRIPFGVNLNIGSKDDEIGFNTYDRTMFFNTNKLNQNLVNGTEQSWPIYHMNGVFLL